LQNLPMKELKGNNTGIIIEETIAVFDTGLAFASPILKKELVQATLTKVQAGIHFALDATAIRSQLPYVPEGTPALNLGLNMPRAYAWRGPSPVQREARQADVWAFK
jgi:hypothetical protein